MEIDLEKLKSLFHRNVETRTTNLGDKTEIPLDDTTGWMQLEIVLKESTIEEIFTQQLLENNLEYFEVVINMASKHINRHIRQETLQFEQKLILKMVELKIVNECHDIYEMMYNSICLGLQDNWSEMRFPACRTARVFLESLDENSQSEYWPGLLPRLCLNRFYTADGVRLYSQETWMKVIKSRGKSLIAQHMESMVNHYIDMSKAENHMVSEASCLAMQELVSRLDSSLVSPFATPLLEAVWFCLQSDSWPIRDAACSASGSFIETLGLESFLYLERFVDVWKEQLSDPIESVRQNAAISFAKGGMSCYQPCKCFIRSFMNEYLLKNIESATSELSENEAKLSKIKFLPDSMLNKTKTLVKENIETDLLRVKPKSVGSWGCCLDCIKERARTKWEVSAGCVVLIAEVLKLIVLSSPQEISNWCEGNDFFSFLDVWMNSIWKLLDLFHFKDCGRFHKILLIQIQEIFQSLLVIPEQGNLLIAKYFISSHIDLILKHKTNANRLASQAAFELILVLQKNKIF